MKSVTSHMPTLRESEIETYANPKLANTVRSRTLHRLTLRGVKTNFFYFRKSPFPGN